jgi:hypothetical protein
MPGEPLWLRAVLRLERAVAESATRATNSHQAADVITLLSRGNRFARRTSARARSAAVHVLSLPSHRDVQVLDAKVERVERMLDELNARVEERDGR